MAHSSAEIPEIQSGAVGLSSSLARFRMDSRSISEEMIRKSIGWTIGIKGRVLLIVVAGSLTKFGELFVDAGEQR